MERGRDMTERQVDVVAGLEAERDEWKKRFEMQEYAHAYGCPECRNQGGTPPHSGDAIDEREEREPGWEFNAERDCPNGYSKSIGDTGDYEWVCGCELVPCTDAFCVHGIGLRERNAIRLERDKALLRAKELEARVAELEAFVACIRDRQAEHAPLCYSCGWTVATCDTRGSRPHWRVEGCNRAHARALLSARDGGKGKGKDGGHE